MRLAEALIKRADLKITISQVKKRIEENAMVQEGDKPAEEVQDLLVLYNQLMDELTVLIKRINQTNAETKLDDMTVADAITIRDQLKSKITAYRSFKDASISKRDYYSRTEIKYVRTTDVAQLQSTIDDLSKQYRELDTKLQEKNWTIDLV